MVEAHFSEYHGDLQRMDARNKHSKQMLPMVTYNAWTLENKHSKQMLPWWLTTHGRYKTNAVNKCYHGDLYSCIVLHNKLFLLFPFAFESNRPTRHSDVYNLPSSFEIQRFINCCIREIQNFSNLMIGNSSDFEGNGQIRLKHKHKHKRAC